MTYVRIRPGTGLRNEELARTAVRLIGETADR